MPDEEAPWWRRAREVKETKAPVRVSSPRNTWGAEWHKLLRDGAWMPEFPPAKRAQMESHVRPLEVREGVLEASVGGPGERPHRVQIRLTPLTDADRTRLARQIIDDRSEASIAADLARGEIPVALVDAADRNRLTLVPRRIAYLAVTCTCGGATLPCDHALGVHLVFARRLYREPQLLLKFRGADPEVIAQLVARIRAESAQSEAPAAAKSDPYAAPDAPPPDWKLIAGAAKPRAPLPSPEGWRAAESFDQVVRRLVAEARSKLG